jgi:hypothetical protein
MRILQGKSPHDTKRLRGKLHYYREPIKPVSNMKNVNAVLLLSLLIIGALACDAMLYGGGIMVISKLYPCGL